MEVFSNSSGFQVWSAAHPRVSQVEFSVTLKIEEIPLKRSAKRLAVAKPGTLKNRKSTGEEQEVIASLATAKEISFEAAACSAFLSHLFFHRII